MAWLPSILRLNHIPRYEYTPSSLSFHPLMVVWLLLPVVYCSCLLNPACVWLRVRCWDGKVTWPGLDPQGCHSVVKEKGKCESRSVMSDSTIHGILQARILEWVAFPFSRGSCQPRDWIQFSCIAGRFFTSWATREAQGEGRSQVNELFSWSPGSAVVRSLESGRWPTFVTPH